MREPFAKTGVGQQAHLHGGSRRGVYNRLRMWAVDGTRDRVFTALMAQADTDEDLEWADSVDSTIVRARQQATEAEKGGPGRRTRRPCPPARDRHDRHAPPNP
ncbi:hypothetical protein ACIHFB_25255 [Streptomyces sp. NPDC051963]|uniref:hypothetical protein n=1 Tax=Streptomyces sp. NPDC051963 TaxID=3365678 RepID=UPI0037CDF845